jgi:spermidine/putrescine transport system ATP-binding protein
MADRIAVMQGGRIEQLGTPTELYERPQTAFVAGFLGVSNLLHGIVSGERSVRLRDGGDVQVGPGALAGRAGDVAVGIRPEKIRFGSAEVNTLNGQIAESAYIGVSTQYIVDTHAGALTVCVQNTDPGMHRPAAGDLVELSFSPEAAFVVTVGQKEEEE